MFKGNVRPIARFILLFVRVSKNNITRDPSIREIFKLNYKNPLEPNPFLKEHLPIHALIWSEFERNAAKRYKTITK